MTSDEQYMNRCFQLALKGLGSAAPNPLVGCIIVYDNNIIGEGYHKSYGSAHAEVNAITSVTDKSLLTKSTLYVNLEPCAHFGKTPPCSDLIVKHNIKRVVVCNKDPFAEVDGKGLQRLREAGIETEIGVLEKNGRELNRRFFTFHEKKRPYIILKWAETADGFIDADRNADSKKQALKISSHQTNVLVHRWRSQEMSILIGRNTAILDNPKLNVRHWSGKNPTRIIIDFNGKLPPSLGLFNDGLTTWIFGNGKNPNQTHCRQNPLTSRNTALTEILDKLHEYDVQSVLVEGGANTINQFIDQKLWDECRIISSQQRLGNGIAAPMVNGEVRNIFQQGADEIKVIYPT